MPEYITERECGACQRAMMARLEQAETTLTAKIEAVGSLIERHSRIVAGARWTPKDWIKLVSVLTAAATGGGVLAKFL